MSYLDTWENPASVERLRTEWLAGTSTAEIGRRLGVSKNAVVGKVHRLGLPERLSPIKQIRDGQLFRPPPPPCPAQTLPPLASELPAPIPPIPRRVSRPRTPFPEIPPFPPLVPASDAPRPVIPAPRPTSRPVQPPVRRGSAQCCWPIGMPRTTAFRFCDDPTNHGPYCDEHTKLAFVRIRDRREATPAHATMGGDD